MMINNELEIHATKWLNLKNMMLRGRILMIAIKEEVVITLAERESSPGRGICRVLRWSMFFLDLCGGYLDVCSIIC